MAPDHDAGFPIRIAVANVSGCGTGAPATRGAAPAALYPFSRGRGAGRGGVARRRAGHPPRSRLDRLGDRDDHAAILERSGGVLAFDLEPDLRDAGLALERCRADEWRRSFAQGQARGPLADWK